MLRIKMEIKSPFRNLQNMFKGKHFINGLYHISDNISSNVLKTFFICYRKRIVAVSCKVLIKYGIGNEAVILKKILWDRKACT